MTLVRNHFFLKNKDCAESRSHKLETALRFFSFAKWYRCHRSQSALLFSTNYKQILSNATSYSQPGSARSGPIAFSVISCVLASILLASWENRCNLNVFFCVIVCDDVSIDQGDALIVMVTPRHEQFHVLGYFKNKNRPHYFSRISFCSSNLQ